MKRFWDKVDKSGDCWEWRACKNAAGYGQFMMSAIRKPRLAHRISYMLHIGPLPQGICVLHRCDNPACVNPSHLFLGTQQDNMADMRSKGRMSAGDNHSIKLTSADVLAIRAARGTHKAIAEQYGVDQSHITRIKNNLVWRNL